MLLKEFPRLYSVARTGKITTHFLTVEQLEDGTCDIVNEHGYVDGAVQVDRRNIKTGKNIGKANETTVQEQAIFDTQSKWNKKKDSNYTENENGIPSADELSLLPMLAQTFDKIDKHGKQVGRKHKIKYDAGVQCKLDGLRGFSHVYTDANITSRKFKPYTAVKHLHKQLLDLFGDLTVPVDGEIYLHGLTLEEINRRAKKYRGAETEELEFHVFDIADTTLTNEQRNEILETVQDKFGFVEGRSKDYPNIVFVQMWTAYSEKDVHDLHDKFVADGYEGAIIRNWDGLYLMEKRSNDLQKYKEFEDEEFKIVGITSGEGREENAIIYICEVKNPKSVKTFEVRPRGSIKKRIQDMQKGENFYIGKELTVRYKQLSELNVPVPPVGIVVRDDK